MANNNYIIAGGKEGKERLNVLSEVLQPYTKELLLRAGLKTGDVFLDNGCGGGNVANMVAEEIVGKTGKVTGTDMDATILELAKKDSVDKNINNTQFITTNAYELPFNREFDVAYCRFLLSHLKEPLNAVLEMKKVIKPGGKIVAEDIQFSGHFSYPESNAFNQYLQWYTEAIKLKGADANIGPRLPELFAAAGVKDISFDVIQPAFQKGHGKGMAYITLDKIKNSLTESNIATTQQVDATLKELDSFTANETTIISLPRIFRVYGTV